MPIALACYMASSTVGIGQPYNLYHVLNHTNLFGASYARQAEQLMQKLLAQGGR